MLTPHFPGRALTKPWLAPMLGTRVLIHLQAAWRSGVVLAALLRDLTPSQQEGGTAPPFWR